MTVTGLSIIALIFILFVSSVNAELKFVQAIFRHGDRAPKNLPYPSDLNKEQSWPRGWSNLTDMGIEQMKELGRFFRERYNKFLSDKYNEDQILIQSSKSPRAQDSARAFLEGFCPSDNLKIDAYCPEVIPSIKTEKGDPLLKPTSFDCPFYERNVKKLNTPIYSNLSKSYRDLFEFLGLHTGHGENITLRQVAKLNDMNREIAHEMPQPSWLYKTWPQYDGKSTLEIVTDIRRIERINEFNKPQLARLRGGFLLADWLQRANKISKDEQKKPSKMVIYSSHDGTLQSLMYSMEIADDLQIPYAATLIMEIHEENQDKFNVKLFYRNNGKLENRKLANCEEECDLDKFIKILNSTAIYSLDALNKECDLDEKHFDVSRSSYYAAVPITIIIFILHGILVS